MIKVEKPSQAQLEELGVIKWPVWEKEVSEFPWEYDSTEVCYILQGRAEVTSDTGKKVVIEAGDLVTFSKGLKCKWKIKKAIRKHYRFE